MEQIEPLTTGRNSALRSSRGIKSLGVVLDEFNQRYLIREKIGAGGIGTVFKAENAETKEMVAVKILNQEADMWFRESFIRERELLRSIESPYIVKFISRAQASLGNFTTDYAYIMNLLEDTPLSNKNLSDRKSNFEKWPEWIRFACRVFRGLIAIHENGYIHGDVSWKNVYKDGVLIDPLAGRIGEIMFREENGSKYFPGSPQFMPIERFEFRTVSPQTDSYSVGVMLYSLFSPHNPVSKKITNIHACGLWHKQPWDSKYKPTILSQQISRRREFPKGIDDIIGRLLDPDPNRRFTPKQFLEIVDCIYSIKD